MSSSSGYSSSSSIGYAAMSQTHADAADVTTNKSQTPIRLGESVAYTRYLPPTTGLSVSTALDGLGSPEKALSRLDRLGRATGMLRDYTYRSNLAPGGLNKYEKPTNRRQRIERRGALEYKQKQLLTILRTVLFRKNRG